MPLTVIILTKNEERNILDCLEGVFGSDQIIVIDDDSSDRTVEVIESLKKKNIEIFKHKLNGDFAKQRDFALSKAKSDWVFFLDADERVPASLFKEINYKIVNSKHRKINGYYIKRRDVMWNRELRYGETGNIKLIRLAKKGAGKWVGKVHEVWDISGEVGDLDNELIHYPHQSTREFLSEINFYSSLRSKQLFDEGKRVKWYEIILFPKIKFFLNYFIRLGFLDGIQGLALALFMSFHSFLVRGKLWLLEDNEKQ